MNEEMYADVISPAGIPRIPDEALKPRPGTLEGATLGILENNKEFSDWVLDRVLERLRASAGIQEVVQRRKHHLAQAAARARNPCESPPPARGRSASSKNPGVGRC